MLSYKEAQNSIESEFSKITLQSEEVSLMESLGRVLAEDIIADADEPIFDNSAMDGIAVKYNSEINEWNLIGEISAGNFKNYNLDDNSCVRIMTGGKMPSNADTVIPVEHLNESEDIFKVSTDKAFKKGQNVRYKGENLEEGETALYKDKVITPRNISVMATCGYENVKVYKQLKIGVLASGDELVEIDQVPDEGKIRASNIYALLSEIKSCNHIPISFGLVNDDRNKLERKVEEVIDSDIDILLTSGGVSVGKYDYLKEILEAKGMETKLWRTYIKPGKPLLFGVIENKGKKKYIFGLPGNPVSSLVTYQIFVKANINLLFKQKAFDTVFAELKSDLKKKDAKRHFSRGILSYDRESEKYYAESSGSSSSGNMMGMSDANCLMIIEEERTHPKKGEKIECIMI